MVVVDHILIVIDESHEFGYERTYIIAKVLNFEYSWGFTRTCNHLKMTLECNFSRPFYKSSSELDNNEDSDVSSCEGDEARKSNQDARQKPTHN